MTKVYFTFRWESESPEEFLHSIRKQTPGNSGVWGDIEGTLDTDEADYFVAFDAPGEDVPEQNLVLLSVEPPCLYSRSSWNSLDAVATRPLEDYYRQQRWWINKTYDELKRMDPVEKSKDLSWITTDKGRNINPLFRKLRELMVRAGVNKFKRSRLQYKRLSTDGHLLRMKFLERLTNYDPETLDLYGRGDFSGSYYRGEVEDKWDGLREYRYSLAIENWRGRNYFTEKVTDALLSWCMPIYWGCTNLDEYLPKNSFVKIDIESNDAPKHVKEIVESDIRERNMDAIAEARHRLLDGLQIWPTVENTIEAIERKQRP